MDTLILSYQLTLTRGACGQKAINLIFTSKNKLYVAAKISILFHPSIFLHVDKTIFTIQIKNKTIGYEDHTKFCIQFNFTWQS